MEQFMEALAEQAVTWGIRIVGVLVALVVSFSIANWVKRLVLRVCDKREFDRTLGLFFANMAKYLVLIAAILGCLGVFGVQTASFAAVIGAAGLAIGLAFQGTLANFASGVMLLTFRPFKVGDVVILDGHTGTVQAIDIFTTEMSALDNRKIILPNRKVFGDTIINLTAHDTRRVDVNVGVEYSADIDATRAVLEKAINSVETGLEEPAPQVFLKELGDSAVAWQLRLWCKTPDFWPTYEALVRATKMELDNADIGIPFPQIDIHLDKDVTEALAA